MSLEFTPVVRCWAVYALFWSGYAFWVGLVVRFFLPGRGFHKPWTSFCLGAIGVALGPHIVKLFIDVKNYDPVSPFGFLVACVFSLAATFLYFVFVFLFPKKDEDDEYENDLADENYYESDRHERRYEEQVNGERYDERASRERRDFRGRRR